MFASIRRHQNWIWFIVVGVIIVSFVIFFSPDVKWGSAGGKPQLGTIDGKQITISEFRDAQQETRLLYFFNFQKWPEQDERARQMGFDMEQETYARLLRLAKLKEAQIHVADEAVAELVKRILGNSPYREFVKKYLEPNGVTAADFERFIRNDTAVQQLAAVVGLSGRLVTPAEAEANFRREHEETLAEAVFFNVTNYLSNITVTNDVISQWYSNRLALFRTPDLVRVSYIEFPKTNFYAETDKRISEITNLNLILEEVYLKAGTNAFKDTNENVLPKTEALAKIKTDEREKMAMHLALRKASELGNELFEKEPRRVENLNALAEKFSLEVKLTEPFDRENGPTNMNVGPEFATTAFALTTEEPIRFEPVAGEDAYYIIGLKESISGQTPPLADIRQKVEEDYRLTQASTLMRQAATSFHARLTNALAQGKDFSEVAKQENLNPVKLPPISQSTETLPELEPKINLRQLKSMLAMTEPGKATPFIPTPPDGGFILYVRAKLPVSEEKLKAELPEFLASMRQYRQNEAFGAWFRRQAEKAGPPFVRVEKQGAPQARM